MRGSGCYAPKEIYKSNKLANVVYNSSEGLSTPVTSPLMPPKPARTGRRLYSWRNSGKREVCMYVRILDPLEFRNNHKKESEYKFNAECSEGGKDVTSSSHSNRKSSKSMTVSNSDKNGIISYSNNYYEIKIKNNLASKGKQGEERDEALRLPDIINGKGMMTSLLHNTITRQQQQQSSLDARVAEQCNSSLIFVTVSIAGVEVVALVDTGATTSCCRWEWYQQWKDHLGAVTKSKIRVMGIAPDPVKVKGLTKPLTLLWDGVGGRFQLAVLPTLHDVDVVLGVDVLSQLNVQFDWVRQVVSPYREPCIQVESSRSIGLLLENPDSTFKGKIPVKEEGVKEVAKDMLRPAYQNLRYCYKAREKKEDRKIVCNQADYRVKLQEDLKDIRQKLCQVSRKELGKKEATRPVNRMEEGVLVDLCEQRSGEGEWLLRPEGNL